MKHSLNQTFITIGALIIIGVSQLAWSADDPSIKGNLRHNIHSAMNTFISQQTIDGQVYLYDAVAGQLLTLSFDNLHDGIVKKHGFYVSCADFYDQHGRKIDVDFLVRPKDDRLVATQAIVHSIDGKKRSYHLENL